MIMRSHVHRKHLATSGGIDLIDATFTQKRFLCLLELNVNYALPKSYVLAKSRQHNNKPRWDSGVSPARKALFDSEIVSSTPNLVAGIISYY